MGLRAEAIAPPTDPGRGDDDPAPPGAASDRQRALEGESRSTTAAPWCSYKIASTPPRSASVFLAAHAGLEFPPPPRTAGSPSASSSASDRRDLPLDRPHDRGGRSLSSPGTTAPSARADNWALPLSRRSSPPAPHASTSAGGARLVSPATRLRTFALLGVPRLPPQRTLFILSAAALRGVSRPCAKAGSLLRRRSLRAAVCADRDRRPLRMVFGTTVLISPSTAARKQRREVDPPPTGDRAGRGCPGAVSLAAALRCRVNLTPASRCGARPDPFFFTFAVILVTVLGHASPARRDPPARQSTKSGRRGHEEVRAPPAARPPRLNPARSTGGEDGRRRTLSSGSGAVHFRRRGASRSVLARSRRGGIEDRSLASSG